MSETKIFKYKNVFVLESGETISNLEIAYHTFGNLNPSGSNVVWVCHALTANSDVFDWWSGICGENDYFNPNEHFIICANIIGSCYGTTGPLSTDSFGQKWFDHFPEITIRDMARAHELLRLHLSIQKINVLIGSSLGGQQAIEWAIESPDLFENLILIATNAVHSPYGIAFNESQRLAIYADSTYGLRKENGGHQGLIAARSIAMLSYRSYEGYSFSQKEKNQEKSDDFSASRYQRYQGWKLANRFNAYSYVMLTKAMDSHNAGRGRISVEKALSKIMSNTLVIGISSDILFPPEEQIYLTNNIANAQFKSIDSIFGHDGFLVENEKLISIFKAFFKPDVANNESFVSEKVLK
jgi:homoserine O-acetyltransferase